MTLNTDNQGHTSYWPEDDDWTMYVQSGTRSLRELCSIAHVKWPGVIFDEVTVTVEKIKTGNVGEIVVDCETDFTCFIVMSISQPLEQPT